jgi:hypothetical protein
MGAGDLGKMVKLANFFGITNIADLDPLRRAVCY